MSGESFVQKAMRVVQVAWGWYPSYTMVNRRPLRLKKSKAPST
jgi:hypothetical protein